MPENCYVPVTAKWEVSVDYHKFSTVTKPIIHLIHNLEWLKNDENCQEAFNYFNTGILGKSNYSEIKQ